MSAQEVLTWADCLAEARKNHPDLISTAESVNQEKAAKEVIGSTLFPQIGVDLDISRAKTGSTTANSYSYGVSGAQLIFDGMKTSSEIKGRFRKCQSRRRKLSFCLYRSPFKSAQRFRQSS